MGFLDSITGLVGKDGASEGAQKYKEGYEAAEKKYKQIELERDMLYQQLKKLNYEIGEEPSILKEASLVKKNCKNRIDCNGCIFNKSNTCVLQGANPSEWGIM